MNSSHSQTEAHGLISLQEDGSLVVMDAKGNVADFVKQGTPRQSVEIDGQSCNISYGFNSAGKKTILLAVPAAAAASVEIHLAGNLVTIPPKSALRVTLGAGDQIEKMDGNPIGTVRFVPKGSVSGADRNQPTPPPSQLTPVTESSSLAAPSKPAAGIGGLAEPLHSPPSAGISNVAAPDLSPSTLPAPDAIESSGWPGKALTPPLDKDNMEEDKFYARTEFGVRFVNALNVVNLPYTQLAFDPGYRQDFFAGVWLTEWFGLGLETGFAVNPARGNTPNLSLSNATYWNVPLLAQLCFQYPNETGWIPYLQVGFGAGWSFLRVGSSTYVADGTSFVSSGNGHGISNAYEITAGLRYRLFDQLSFSMAYKLYGCSQVNLDFASGNVTLDSPLTNTFQLGFQYSF